MRLDRHLDYYFDVQDQGADPTGNVDASQSFHLSCFLASQQPGGGTVVAVGKFKISATVIVFSGAKLDLRNAYIVAGANVNLFQLKPEGQIIGGIFDTTLITYTSNVVYLNGKDQFWASRGPGHVGLHAIRHCQFVGTEGTGTGKAIFVECQGGTQPYYAYGVLLMDIRIFGYEYGIHFVRSGTAGQSFINGNHLVNIWGWRTVRFIRFEDLTNTAGADVQANMFRDIDYEWGPSAVDAFYLTGSYNQVNIQVWDFPGNSIQLPVGSSHNRIVLSNGAVNNLGTANTIVFL